MIPKREWKDHAWELCRRTNSPGCVELVVQAMEFGYKLGVADVTKVIAKTTDAIRDEKERAAAPH